MLFFYNRSTTKRPYQSIPFFSLFCTNEIVWKKNSIKIVIIIGYNKMYMLILKRP